MTLEAIAFDGWTLLGIIAGGLAYFFLGALWYMTLFQKPWIAATGRSAEDFEGKAPGAEMLLTLVGAVVSTAVIGLVYGWAGGATILDGAVIGAILGIGVAAMEGLKPAVYNFDERVKPWALYGVNGSYAVCGMTLAGTVYAAIS